MTDAPVPEWDNPPDTLVRSLLTESHVIAVVGLAPKETRPSHRVAAYMKDAGYRIIPVRRLVKEVLGERAYDNIADIPGSVNVDIIDIFRRSEEVVAIVETNSCFSDGVQFVTGCSFGNNALIYRDYGKTAVTLARRTGEAIRVAAKASGGPLERYPEAAELFGKVVRERRGTEEDSEKLRRLWIDIAFDMLDIPDEGLFTTSRENVKVPAYARIFTSVKCSVCGENVMEPRARMKEGKPVCLSCSDHEYYQLAGDGMSIVTCR